MTRQPQFTLAQLLQVEDADQLLGFVCVETGILLWPHVRTVFIRMAMSDLLYRTPLDGSVSKGVPTSRALATMGRSLLHNAGMRVSGQARAEICFLTSGIGNQALDGQLINRLSDHFARARPDQSLTVEDHFHWRWPGPRQNQRVLLHAPLQAWNALCARVALRAAHRKQAAQLVALVSARSNALLGWRPGPQREQVLVELLARKIAGMPGQLRAYQALLGRIKPTLLFMLGACYGPSATLIRAARDQGVTTAEYQHGTIAPGHDGYNFGTALLASKAYRASLPDHFLSYGSWWNDRVNAPVSMWAIGNPHRQYRLARLGTAAAKDVVLILADGIEFALYVALARQLAPAAARQGLRVVIRPHPLERVIVAEKYGKSLDKTIAIDDHDDLYVSMMEAHAVVSELSTGLFEAVGVADKLFMWDTPKARFCFPTLPFESFSSAEELLGLLGDDHAGRLPEHMSEGMWAAQWQDNYTDFLAHCGVSVHEGAKQAHD